jgi:hypothetical protein
MHRIHLRGPWQLEPGDGSPAVTIRMPLEPEALGNLHGPVRLIRRFNRPTNLSPNERVFVVLEGWENLGRVAVNGVVLDAPLDATRSLQLHNVLTIDVEGLGLVVGEATLEIRGASSSGGVTLGHVLSQPESFDLSHSLFLPETEVWANDTECLVLAQSDVDGLPEEARVRQLVYAIGIAQIVDVFANLKTVRSSPTAGDVLKAFLFYYDNDAFISSEQLDVSE